MPELDQRLPIAVPGGLLIQRVAVLVDQVVVQFPYGVLCVTGEVNSVACQPIVSSPVTF